MMSDLSDESAIVTIVIICRNGEQFLNEAIRSVLAQTYIAWELMLVDDGSTDRSSEIARSYAARRPRKIHYLEHPNHENRGMSASRNLGIRCGKGKYIALLDSDDVWHPEKLARQTALLDQMPDVEIVYNATLRWFSWTGHPEDRLKDEPRRLGFLPGIVIKPPGMIPLFLRDEGQTPATCSVLMRRQAVEAVGGFEERFRSLHEDQAFFYKFFLRYSAFIQPGHWDFYRQHRGSCCFIASGGAPHTILDEAQGQFLHWLNLYLKTNGIRNPELIRELERARRPFCHRRQYRVEQSLLAGSKRVRSITGRFTRKLLAAIFWRSFVGE